MATYTFSRPYDTLGSWAPWPQRRRTCQWTQPYRWRTETVGLVRVGHCAGFFSNCCWQLVALRAPGLYGIACVKCLSCFQAFSPNIVRFVVPDYSIWHSSVWHWKICSWVCKQRDLASVEDAKTETTLAEQNRVDMVLIQHIIQGLCVAPSAEFDLRVEIRFELLRVVSLCLMLMGTLV